MTLSRGDKIIKLGADGKPLTTVQEAYILYQIERVQYYQEEDGTSHCFAILKKLE